MSTKYPPLLDFNKAVQTIKSIYDIHAGDRFNLNLLVDILETTKDSSNFPGRTSALIKFELLDRENETVQLTPLAIQIAHPVAGEDVDAKITAFKKVDVLDDLLRRYPNAKLPTDANQLKKVLLNSLNIHRDTVEKWYDFVINSFRAISGFTNIPSTHPEIQKAIPSQPDIVKTDSFRIPLTSGKAFEFSMPNDMNNDDLDFVISFFELRKKKGDK